MLKTITLATALALGSSTAAWAQSAAERAVEAAKQYSGTTISIVWEAGLQALDPLNFSGPKWKELTGIDVQVIEVPVSEMFTKILQEHRAGTGAYDALNVIPSWMPDLAMTMASNESAWPPTATSSWLAPATNTTEQTQP
jgi:multiple sugar transport system substrate-binding protein